MRRRDVYASSANILVELVESFYEGVASDALLRPLYPSQDLTDAKARLCGFLVQYWGGPADYSAARGHPRLRMRHAPYAIGEPQRDAWLAHMTLAVDETIDNYGFPPALGRRFSRHISAMRRPQLNSPPNRRHQLK